MSCQSIVAFPTELLCSTVSYVEDRVDLLNLALTCHRLCNIIIPDYHDYHSIQCLMETEKVWENLAQQPALSKRVRSLHVKGGKLQGVSLNHTHVPKTCTSTGTTYGVEEFKSALRQMPNLNQLKMLVGLHSRDLNEIVQALIESKVLLKRLEILYRSQEDEDAELPTSFLRGLDFTRLTHFRVKVSRVDKDDINVILCAAPSLVEIYLHAACNISEVLSVSTWRDLKRFSFGYHVSLFSTDMISVDEKKNFFASFLQRHPSLEWMFLPSPTRCFPSIDVCPNLRALQCYPCVPSDEFPLPSPLAQRLSHFAIWLNQYTFNDSKDMSNLQSCMLIMRSHSAPHVRSFLRCTPRVRKLRIDIYDRGIQVIGCIEKIINTLIDLNLQLTHLISLLDDLDVQRLVGKVIFEKLVTRIPTLQYTSATVAGKTVFLKINRKDYRYKDFSVISGADFRRAIDDPYLNDWGQF